MSGITGTAGADRLGGTLIEDMIDAGTGNDQVDGLSGNDFILGGGGNDTLAGNTGDDKVFGSGAFTGAVDMDKLRIAQDVEGSVTFLQESAGFKNTLGVYKIASDGTIYDVQVLFANASLKGSGGNLVSGKSTVGLDLQAGDQLGFFVVPDAYRHNNKEVLEQGRFEMRGPDGEAGNVNDGSAVKLVNIDADGKETVVQSQYKQAVFHSLTGAEGGLNPDGYDHVTGDVDVGEGTIRVGFEDLWNGGDKDFDDSVFLVNIGSTNAALLARAKTGDGVAPDHDLIMGGAGNDELFGMRDNDTVSGGDGDDKLWGNSGDDVLSGDAGNDELRGGSGDDVVSGGEGNDALFGNSGDDALSGDAGDDSLMGQSGNDTLDGGDGNDKLDGGSGDDVFIGGHGDDVYNGGSGVDTLDYSDLEGGLNVDLHKKVVTGAGEDQVQSIESVVGSQGDDVFKGDKRDNMFSGGEGDDMFRGLGGADTFFGGEGSDTYKWYAKDIVDQRSGEHLGVDTIADFQPGDVLDLHDVLKGQDGDVGDLVSATTTDRGTIVSVSINDQMVDVVMLEGVRTSVESLVEDGSLLS
ncbi:MAG: calcium-binding protein [Pseudomonadota bacterium]